MKASFAAYLSAFLAAVLFLVFHYYLVFPARQNVLNWLMALALAAVAYAGFLLILPRQKSLEAELAGLTAFSGANVAEAVALFRTALAKVDLIRGRGAGLKTEAGGTVRRIADIAQAIVEALKEDPSDISRSKQFLFHYLDATLDIIEKYTELTDKKGGPQIRSVLEKSEQTLLEIEAVFHKQYQRNLANEAMELDVNLDTLKNMIQSEGL